MAVNFKAVGLTMIIVGGGLQFYMDVLGVRAVSADVILDLGSIKELLLVPGFFIFILALMGSLLQYMNVGETLGNAAGWLGGRVAGGGRPRQIGMANARIVMQGANPTIELRWQRPPANDNVERIVITRRALNAWTGENFVGEVMINDPGFNTATFIDTVLTPAQVAGRIRYFVYAQNAEGRSPARRVDTPNWNAPLPPPAPAGPYAGLPGGVPAAPANPQFTLMNGNTIVGTFNAAGGPTVITVAPGQIPATRRLRFVYVCRNGSLLDTPRGLGGAGVDGVVIQAVNAANAPVGAATTVAVQPGQYNPFAGGAIPRDCGWFEIEVPIPAVPPGVNRYEMTIIANETP